MLVNKGPFQFYIANTIRKKSQFYIFPNRNLLTSMASPYASTSAVRLLNPLVFDQPFTSTV